MFNFYSLQVLNEVDVRRGKNDLHIQRDQLCDEKTYQLYTLYRDKDGNIKQVTDKFTSSNKQTSFWSI